MSIFFSTDVLSEFSSTQTVKISFRLSSRVYYFVDFSLNVWFCKKIKKENDSTFNFYSAIVN